MCVRVCVCVCVCVCARALSCVRLFSSLQTVARQTPLSLGFSRQQYWSGLPLPTPGGRPNPGIKPSSLASALEGRFFTTESPGKPEDKCRKIEIGARDAES